MRRSPARTPHRRPQRGVAAVEFAVVAMLFVTLLLGASEFGRAMVQYDTVVKSARAASRHLSQFAPGDAAAWTAARNLAVHGNTAGAGAAQVPGLTTSMVAVCDASNCAANRQQPFYAPGGALAGRVNLVTVTISGLQFQPLATWILPAITFAPIQATMPQGGA